MATTDYDHVRSINIGPWGINQTGESLHGFAQNVADSLRLIENTLLSLSVGNWMGSTQQEADDFNNRWLAVGAELFGSSEKPDDGVLNAMCSGIYTAVQNYNKTEFALVDAWKQFAGMFADGQGGDGAPSKDTPPDVLDTNKTAITADYPPYNS